MGVCMRPLQRRCRLVDPEIDAMLFTVDELLELSPERYPTTTTKLAPAPSASGIGYIQMLNMILMP